MEYKTEIVTWLKTNKPALRRYYCQNLIFGEDCQQNLENKEIYSLRAAIVGSHLLDFMLGFLMSS